MRVHWSETGQLVVALKNQMEQSEDQEPREPSADPTEAEWHLEESEAVEDVSRMRGKFVCSIV